MSNVFPLVRHKGIEITLDKGEDDGVTYQDDGSAIVDLRPPKQRNDRNASFDENLAEIVDDGELDYTASTLIDAIEDDERSRSGWLESYEKAIDLLGVKIEDAPNTGALGLTRSTIRNPVLLEACIRFQSNARGELLPADGPVKVRIDDNENPQTRDLAGKFQKDLNHYLTTTATEYYPDFDRMLFHVAFAGCAFRKIYDDPLRGRPVSESVYAPDLIVSQDITDLENANRITHKIQMRQSVMKRMQLFGVYRDIDLSQPSRIMDPIKDKIKDQQGLAAWSVRPEDQPYEVLECYTELDLKGFEHKDGHEYTGLPLPYQVTLERTSRKILSIRRNWRKTDRLMRAVPRFVKYGMGSGLGFYDLGYAHILGNSARTLTAIWRLLIDAGMFSNFPGFLLKKGARVGTTQIRIGPGEAKEIETGSADDIRQSVMPLPYKEPSATLMEFAKQIEENARQLAGMAEIEVGEGKQEAPVGTTIALIEQATKVMAAVHKRLHQSMQQEFRILQELFAANPKALWTHSKSPARQWEAGQEMSNFDLVPAADPNVASQMMRVMKVQGLVQLAQQDPSGFNLHEIRKLAVKALGFDEVDSIVKPPGPDQQQPDPKLMVAQLQASSKEKEMATNAQLTQMKIASDERLKQLQMAHDLSMSQDRSQERASREKIAQMRSETEASRMQQDGGLKQQDLFLSHQQHQDKLAADLHKHHTGMAHEQQLAEGGAVKDQMQHIQGLQSTHTQADSDREHALELERQRLELEQDKLFQQDVHHNREMDQRKSELKSQAEIAKAKIEADKAKAKAQKAQKGIAKFFEGGRVTEETANIIHVHPNVIIQPREKPKTERTVRFIMDAQGNVIGAKVVDEEVKNDIEVEIIGDDE